MSSSPKYLNYPRAILDICDQYIVSYIVSESNDDTLVFNTLDKAVQANPNVHPLFYSDRGFQYTNQTFHHKFMQAGMTQGMFRVMHCIDNGPKEGLWSILIWQTVYQ